jgi:hypothetical protein
MAIKVTLDESLHPAGPPRWEPNTCPIRVLSYDLARTLHPRLAQEMSPGDMLVHDQGGRYVVVPKEHVFRAGSALLGMP